MSANLAGKNIIVTGGLGALGKVLADHLAQQGAKVAIVDRGDAAGVSCLPGSIAIGGVDLGDTAAAMSAFAQVRSQFGAVDGLVNVAGGFAWEKVQDGTISTWDRMYEVNLRTAVVASQAVIPHLLERGAGRIVNIGALGSLKAGMGMGAYAASKSGVARFTEALAEELKDNGINVNAVLPSIIDTPANRGDMPGADTRRWVTPQALALVIAFLLSDDSAAVTGACLPVAGRM